MATSARVAFWRDKQLGAAFLAAPFFWSLLWWWNPSLSDPAWPLREPWRFFVLALVYPVLEEIVFRGGVQTVLLRHHALARSWRGVSLANFLTSVAFAGFHLFAHAPMWAAAVFVPSIVFGYFRDRHDSVTSPIVLHVFYNVGYFWLFGR